MIYRRDLDNQGCCNQWQHGIRTINNQYPDDNRDFDINAGDGIEITPATAGITIAVKAPLPGPMVYQGTVGTGGTIASLPAANVTNIGWTYIAITAGTTPDDTPKSYEIGDMIISNGEEWTVVPAGDDPVLWGDIQNKPTTLSGYGITDAVDIASAQNITGTKTFKTSGYTSVKIASERITGNRGGLDFYDGNGNRQNSIYGSCSGIIALHPNPDNTATDNAVVIYNQRAYNSANTNDIVTIGSLQASSDVVHRTGNETVGGNKNFIDEIQLNTKGHLNEASDTSGEYIQFRLVNGNNTAYLVLRMDNDNVLRLQVIKNLNGTFTSSTVATL